MIAESARVGRPVAARGRGHTTGGQALTAGTVLDMRALSAVHQVSGDRVVVDGGASWRDVLAATLPHGLTPPVLTDYLGISVGGTLSAGGVGGCSSRYGLQTDNVLGLRVVTGDGVERECGPGERGGGRLFDAVLGGLGQCGVITQATLRLVAAPVRVRRFQLCYSSAVALMAAQRRALGVGRFDYLEGQIVAGEGGSWRYMLEGVVFDSNKSDVDLVGDLGSLGGGEEVEEISYGDFADRMASAETCLRSTGEWLWPHPWWNGFVPDGVADGFVTAVAEELTPADLGASGLMLVYPLRTDRMRTRLARVPAASVVFLVALLRTGPADDRDRVDALVADNRRWFERARDVGGVQYPVGSIPFDRDDWRGHFDAEWEWFAGVKREFDPAGILAPGQGIF